MKILILLKCWGGGLGTYVLEVKRELERQGHFIKVISREDDLKIFSLKKSIFKIRKKVKELMKGDYDIIYTEEWSIAFPLLFPFPIFKKKHYCGFGGIQLGKSKILQNIVAKRIGKRLISFGDPVKNEFPFSTQIFSGINLERFRPIKDIKKIKNSIGFVNCPEDIWNFNMIKEAVEKTGKKFFNVWGIPNKEIPEFYNKIEIFISLPPNCTGFNLCWLEAMACGVPKIIGNNSGIGCRLPIDKIEDFKNIEDAILNAKEKDYRVLIGKEFTWENHVNKLLELWKN